MNWDVVTLGARPTESTEASMVLQSCPSYGKGAGALYSSVDRFLGEGCSKK